MGAWSFGPLIEVIEIGEVGAEVKKDTLPVLLYINFIPTNGIISIVDSD
ncbi:MAG: hypothetical protein ACFE9R_18245 [Candidatus Hermodarchaeota archaeon]